MRINSFTASYSTPTASPKPNLNTQNSPEQTTAQEQTKTEEKSKKQDFISYLDSPDVRLMVAKLKARDSEVRAHEAAHMSAGGGVAGGASYTYQKGPDGQQYAIGGEVPIDMSSESTPQATESKMQKVRAAALAPANPSPQDIKIASTASMLEMRARMESMKEKQSMQNGERDKATNTAPAQPEPLP